eukprot:1160960-Pelagomonas_calceolata.AAC.2
MSCPQVELWAIFGWSEARRVIWNPPTFIIFGTGKEHVQGYGGVVPLCNFPKRSRFKSCRPDAILITPYQAKPTSSSPSSSSSH